MPIADGLQAAYENLLRVIPEPLTAEEEQERRRTGKEDAEVDSVALHDGARRFVEAISEAPRPGRN